MAKVIGKPFLIEAASLSSKSIEKFFGRVASQSASIIIAHMISPTDWSEPGQTPEFDEYMVFFAVSCGLKHGIKLVTLAQVKLL